MIAACFNGVHCTDVLARSVCTKACCGAFVIKVRLLTLLAGAKRVSAQIGVVAAVMASLWSSLAFAQEASGGVAGA